MRSQLTLLAATLTSMMIVGTLGPAQDAVQTPSGPSEWSSLRIDLTGAPDDSIRIPLHVPAPTMATGIGPGHHLLMEMDGSTYGCTSSFVFSSGSTLYLGAAGHCFLPPDKTATHGTGADWDPADTTVWVCVSGCYFGGQTGFIITGTLVELGAVAYARQTGTGGDVGNDFGVVTIPTNRESLVSNAVPMWGGPTSTGTLSLGEPVCHYGYGMVGGETFPTQGRAGVGMGANAVRWLANTAAAPGDSGSALVTCGQEGTSGVHGKEAIGTLTHLNINTGVVAGTTVSQGISMATQASLSLTLELA